MRPTNSVREEGYLTLDNVPDADARRAFLIPTDPQWFGVFMGALAPLLNEEAWRKFGALTPEECVAVWQEIFFSSPPCGCELPGGSKVIRINPATGQLEELSEDTGEWQAPTGDYAVPPITQREGGTTEEQRCLAAANAAHVLEVLYESLTDSIGNELEYAEALTAMVTAFILAVGWEVAPIAFAIAAFFLAVFAIVYEIVKLIGSDLWDETFTDVLKCALYNCATDDGEGIVTFDWTCTQNALAAGTDALNFDQLRLFNQLFFIIQSIGGADGLNQAGATTSISSADCTDCGDSFCWEWYDVVGTTSIQTIGEHTFTIRTFYVVPSSSVHITKIVIDYEQLPNSGNTGDYSLAQTYDQDSGLTNSEDISNVLEGQAVFEPVFGQDYTGIYFQVSTAWTPEGANYPNIPHICIEYTTTGIVWESGSACP